VKKKNLTLLCTFVVTLSGAVIFTKEVPRFVEINYLSNAIFISYRWNIASKMSQIFIIGILFGLTLKDKRAVVKLNLVVNVALCQQ